jgi:hypothetical protein
LSAPPEPFVPEEHRFKNGHALIVVGYGSPEDHARVITPVREGMKPLFELVTPIPFVALQQMLNESSRWGTLAYEKARYLDSLSDAAIAVIGEHAPKKKSPLSFLPTFRLDGKYLARSDADSAFGGSRSGGYVLNIAAHAPPGAPRDLYEADRAWVRSFWDAMRPHATGSGSYVNFMTDVEEDRVKAAYGRGIRPPRPHQARVGPGQRLPPERQHQAGVSRGRRRFPRRRQAAFLLYPAPSGLYDYARLEIVVAGAAGERGSVAIVDRIEPKPVAPNSNHHAVVVIVVTPHSVAFSEGPEIVRVVRRKSDLHCLVPIELVPASASDQNAEASLWRSFSSPSAWWPRAAVTDARQDECVESH